MLLLPILYLTVSIRCTSRKIMLDCTANPQMASFFGEDLSQRCRFEGPHPLSGATLAKKGRIQGESTGRDIASEQCPSLNA